MSTLAGASRFAAFAGLVPTVAADEGQSANAAVRDRVGEASDVDHFVASALLQLPERHGFDLSDSLPGHSHLASYLLQRHPFGVRLDGADRFGVLPPFELRPRVTPGRRGHMLQLQPQRQRTGSDSHTIPMVIMGINRSALISDTRIDSPFLGYRRTPS